jgi:hypothetical protein
MLQKPAASVTTGLSSIRLAIKRNDDLVGGTHAAHPAILDPEDAVADGL